MCHMEWFRRDFRQGARATLVAERKCRLLKTQGRRGAPDRRWNEPVTEWVGFSEALGHCQVATVAVMGLAASGMVALFLVS